MKKNIKVISLIILLLDILSKRLIINNINLYDSIKIINNFIYITYTQNNGVAFSFLEGSRIFIIIISFSILFYLIYYVYKNRLNNIQAIGFSMIIGGALGNLIDRVIYGYVIDFIDIYIFGYDYPIFNIADIAVVLGVILILVNNFFEKRGEIDGNNSR